MDEDFEIDAGGIIARVTDVEDGGRKVYFEQQDGHGGHLSVGDPDSFIVDKGQVLILWPDRNRVDRAPPSVWNPGVTRQAQESVAVVRLKTTADTVVDEGGKWRLIRTAAAASYKEGNTVVVSPQGEVTRVLSEKSLRLVDLGADDDVDVGRFKTDLAALRDGFDDFGGLEQVVARARSLIELPLKQSEKLSNIGARPIRGILFSGPPGTGKTMLARIIAKHAGAPFYTVSGPEILSKWYGRSEAVLRAIFEDAAKQERAVIFFDEIDTVASSRSGSSHEASQKLVGQLLTLMDGFSPSKHVVVVAATNRPESLDHALRRPGRFDWEVQFSLPGLAARQSILERSARSLAVDENLPHREIAASTDGWTPAELSGIWSEAALLAAGDGRSRIHSEDYREGHRRVALQRRQRESVHG